MEMKLNLNRFRSEERVAMVLKELYEGYGYTPYRMSKFEEYELYSRNRDFLGNSSILTFTDTNGKLMALKPDVTLSIVKNSKSDIGTEKVYYNENVYRVTGRGGSFREIPQSGIECIGNIGTYEIAEILILALKSLEATGRPFRLDISHMGILSSLIDEMNVIDELRGELFTCIRRKNTDGIKDIANRCGHMYGPKLADAIGLNGSVFEVLNGLKSICGSDADAINELQELVSIISSLGYADNIGIDLSVVNDMSYYRSLVFRGYIDCVPEGILFGGRYDDLVIKMGRKAGAVGFAVMLDKLQELSRNDAPVSSDILLLYSKKDSVSEVISACEKLRAEGKTVLALPDDGNIPDHLNIKYLSSLKEC